MDLVVAGLFSGISGFFGGIASAFGAISWETIFQLTFVALIMLAGPAVIFVLALRGGDM